MQKVYIQFPAVSYDSDGDGFTDKMEEDNGFNAFDPNDNPAASGSPGGLAITNGKLTQQGADPITLNPIIIQFTVSGFTGPANLYYKVVPYAEGGEPVLSGYPDDSLIAQSHDGLYLGRDRGRNRARKLAWRLGCVPAADPGQECGVGVCSPE
jgi:hypothetical protein